MKRFFTLLISVVFTLPLAAQDGSEYYRKIFPRTIGAKPYTTESLLKQFGGVRIHDRWYAGANGFLRKDVATITSTLDGLIGTESPTVGTWSAVAGWVGLENWAVEAEYSRAPVHNVLLINGAIPLKYNLTNNKNSLTLRGKRRLMFNKKAVRKSAFWLGGGVGIIPSAGQQKSFMEFQGYRERGRRAGFDTLFLTSSSFTAPHATLLFEASAEYIIHVSRAIDLGLFGRKHWGAGQAMATHLVYSVNGQESAVSDIRAAGSGWSIGLSLRYVFQIGYDFSRLHDGLKVSARSDQRRPNTLSTGAGT